MPADYKTLLGLVREFYEWFGGDRAITDCSEVAKLYRATLPEGILDRARAAIAPSAPKPENDPRILNCGEFDNCCWGPFNRASHVGALDKVDAWTCPKCGSKFKVSEQIDDIRYWSYVCEVSVIR